MLFPKKSKNPPANSDPNPTSPSSSKEEKKKNPKSNLDSDSKGKKSKFWRAITAPFKGLREKKKKKNPTPDLDPASEGKKSKFLSRIGVSFNGLWKKIGKSSESEGSLPIPSSLAKKSSFWSKIHVKLPKCLKSGKKRNPKPESGPTTTSRAGDKKSKQSLIRRILNVFFIGRKQPKAVDVELTYPSTSGDGWRIIVIIRTTTVKYFLTIFKRKKQPNSPSTHPSASSPRGKQQLQLKSIAETLVIVAAVSGVFLATKIIAASLAPDCHCPPSTAAACPGSGHGNVYDLEKEGSFPCKSELGFYTTEETQVEKMKGDDGVCLDGRKLMLFFVDNLQYQKEVKHHLDNEEDPLREANEMCFTKLVIKSELFCN